MNYSLRICRDHDGADKAQGWVVAQSELQANELLGTGSPDLDQIIESLELERENLIHALAAAEQSLKSADSQALQLPFAWLVVDADTRILKVSDDAKALLGLQRTYSLAKIDFGHATDRQNVAPLKQAIDMLIRQSILPTPSGRSRICSYDIRFESSAGELKTCLMTVAPYLHASMPKSSFAVTFSELRSIKVVSAVSFRESVDDLVKMRAAQTQEPEHLTTGLYFLEERNFFIDPEKAIKTDQTPDIDVTTTVSVQDERRGRPTIDLMTGCFSRGAILGLLETEIANARSSGRTLNVVSVDIDAFKTINDGFGHHVGDAVIKAAGARIRHVLADRGFVGRLSGDEFLIVIPTLGNKLAKKLIDDVLNEIRLPLPVEGTKLIATCSAGIASFPQHADNGLDIVRASDLALYKSKASGRDMLSVFEPSMFDGHNRNLKIIRGLHKALASETFNLVYQTQHALTGDRRMIGAEALIRWNDAELGDVPPSEFIPLAYQCGLGLSIDLWVMKKALSQKAQWEATGNDFTLSINTSASSFLSVGFSNQILGMIKMNRITPSQITIEVTEATLMQTSPVCSQNLENLRKAGVGISIDDFGTGYSSLALIHKLQPSEIKIDRSFVSRMAEKTPIATKPLELILSFAQSLGVHVVAEGIEYEQQFEWLACHGCHSGQGYLLSRPVTDPTALTASHG